MYKSLDVLNSGRGVVPNSVVYKYSDPTEGLPRPSGTPLLELISSVSLCEFGLSHSHKKREEECAKSSD